jgi:hypothetical protein
VGGSSEGRLDSWKEIAEYLGRDVRTVRRWERGRSLPVHRVPGGGRAGVYAFRSEVDAWLRGQEGSASSNGDGEGGAGRMPALPGSIAASPTAEADRPVRATERNRGRKAWWLAAAVIAAFGLGFVSYRVWLYYYGGPPVRVEFSGNELLAWNERGRLLWPYDFGQPLRPDPDPPATDRVAIVNLGRTRQHDLLAAAPLFSSDRTNPPSDALYCFSARGKLRWHHPFDGKPQFGGHLYDSPWAFSALMVTRSDSAPSIWCSVRQYYSSASTVVEFDRDGNKLAQFVNWGHIDSLNYVREASGSYVLAGGISNQSDCAFLAVLREDHASGSSPALSSGFQCDNCPPGEPYRYLLFPRSELTRLSGATYNNLRLIQVDGSHVSVGVSETTNPGVPGPDWEQYDLSKDFVPQSVWISDHFWTLHREMEVEGKIHHTVEQCPERTQPQPVRMWSPETGWKEIKVPVVPVPR